MKKLPILILLFFLLSLISVVSFHHFLGLQLRPKQLRQDSLIQVYFNHNNAQDYTDPYRKIKRSGDNLEKILINTINSAQSTIDVAVQELRLPYLAQALVQCHHKGIKVRVILENSYNYSLENFNQTKINQLDEYEQTHYQDLFALIDINKDHQLSSQEMNQRDALVILKNADIPIIDDTSDGSKGSALMHHKFIIVDQATLIISSANFTLSDIHGDYTNPKTRGNANHLLKIKSSQLSQIFTQEFNTMWGNGANQKLDSHFGTNKPYKPPYKLSVGASQITVNFSPISKSYAWNLSSNGLINQFLNKANQSVNLALFVFSEQQLANTLETKHQQGKKIKALIDPRFAFRYYSEGLDMLGVALSNHCKYELDNHPWQKPINTVGVPNLLEGDKLHHKFAIIDNSFVITGSHNWSKAANNNNDETLIVIENPVIAAHFTQEFQRLYQPATLGIPHTIKEQINKDNSQCSHLVKTSSHHKNQIVNLNTASQVELESLPGIGTSTAKRIIVVRQQKPFTSLQDLDKVSGIGSSTLKKLEGKVTW